MATIFEFWLKFLSFLQSDSLKRHESDFISTLFHDFLIGRSQRNFGLVPGNPMLSAAWHE